MQLLLFLDDYSRFILRGRFCHRSGRVPVFSALRETFLAYGLPKAVLTDRGPEFCAHGGSGETEYQVALRLLGVNPVLARPYHPMTKGKVERLFRFIQRDFLAEARDEVQSLPELNAAFERWVKLVQSGAPAPGVGKPSPGPLVSAGEPAPEEDVLAALTLEYPRKVGKDGRISFEGCSYQLPKGYAGARVWVKLTTEGPEVWYRDKPVPSAEVPRKASAEQVWSFGTPQAARGPRPRAPKLFRLALSTTRRRRAVPRNRSGPQTVSLGYCYPLVKGQGRLCRALRAEIDKQQAHS